MMKSFGAALLLSLLAMQVSAQEVCLDVHFEEGIPADFTLVCHDDMPVKTQDFKRLNLNKTWFVALVDSEDGVAAMSTSHRLYDLPTDNWMITPKLKLPAENVFLKWTSRAIHYHLRDGYKVMISTIGTGYEDFTEIAHVAEEEYLWTKHVVSLNEYAGKEVYIAFVHDSQNKFLLAMDNLFVGQPSEADFVVKDETPRFVGQAERVTVKGKACNSGKVQPNSQLECVTQWGDTLKAHAADARWMTGESLDFSFDVPVKVGAATRYKVELDGENGERYTLLEDSVICSYYARKIFLEKATGTWCNNCPEMISYIQELKERYGEQMVCVEVHGPAGYGGDIWAYAPYYDGMQTNTLPMVMFNRQRSKPIYKSTAKDRRVLGTLVNAPTVAHVDVEAMYEGGDSVKATAKVVFATEVTGNYRVGFALIENKVQTELMRQVNNAMSEIHGEYSFLSARIAPELMWYCHVVRSDNMAFNGIKNSLPEKIEPGVEYTVEASMNVPDLVSDKSDMAVVAIVMNYNTDEVMNVDKANVAWMSDGIHPMTGKTDTEPLVEWTQSGALKVIPPMDLPFTAEIFSLEGRMVRAVKGEGTPLWIQNPDRGIYLLKIVQAERVWTRKIGF